MISQHLFVPSKSAYVKGARPDVACVLCEVVARRDTVTRLEVAREDGWVAAANLYPYNPGHLMLFPERHVEDTLSLTESEVLALHRLLSRCLLALRRLYEPSGFNVGCNVGRSAGASVSHLHVHLVPRFPTELGFMDIVGGARVIVEDPTVTCRRVAEALGAAPAIAEVRSS